MRLRILISQAYYKRSCRSICLSVCLSVCVYLSSISFYFAINCDAPRTLRAVYKAFFLSAEKYKGVNRERNTFFFMRSRESSPVVERMKKTTMPKNDKRKSARMQLWRYKYHTDDRGSKKRYERVIEIPRAKREITTRKEEE